MSLFGSPPVIENKHPAKIKHSQPNKKAGHFDLDLCYSEITNSATRYNSGPQSLLGDQIITEQCYLMLREKKKENLTQADLS